MTTLRRLPWTTDEGKPAFVPAGNGIVNHLADVLEAEMIATAEMDRERALAVADDPAASKPELRLAIRYLAHAAQDAASVAELRAERLDG
jgi:hypothetical protein